MLPAADCRILEIGTGTGSASNSLAKTGRPMLFALTNDLKAALDVAHIRAETFGVADRFSTYPANGADLASVIDLQTFRYRPFQRIA